MKALFIHDHPFIKNAETKALYTSGNLNSVLWERYLRHFETVTVIGRCKTESDTSRYHFAERDNVIFKLFTDVSGGIDYFKKRKLIEKRLADEISQHDVVILRFPATISVFAAEYCIKHGIRYIAEVVGCSWDANWNYGGVAPKIIASYSYFKMKKAVKHATAAIYVTEEFLQKRYPTLASITANASNVIIKEVQEDILPQRLEMIKSQKDVGNIRIGVIGNIAVKYKGYDILIKAVANLPNEIKRRIHISFVGGGDPRYIKQLITKYQLGENTKILGKLKAGKEIFDFLDSLDIYVHPSKQEGLPRVVIEAMSRACPILASTVAGTPELLSNDFLHQPGDYKKLARDIIKVATNSSIKERMAKDNFAKSKNYLFSVLENRRQVFFEGFINEIS